jgi:hypothetical protein
MCYHLVILAAMDEEHTIMQCEHGSIHIQWGIATFHITQEELLILTEALRGPFFPDVSVLAQTSLFVLRREAGQGFALRLREVELHVPTADFWFLSHMLQRSCSILTHKQQRRRDHLSPVFIPFVDLEGYSMN